MPSTRTRRWVVVCLLLAAIHASASAGAAPKEWVSLKNGMTSPITVLVQAKQRTGPAQFRILVGDTFKCPLEDDGPFTVQVIPDDQPDSGYHLGSHDLRQLGRSMRGRPVELKGETGHFMNLTTGGLVEARKSVYFDTPLVADGFAIRTTASRMDYIKDEASGEEPQPAGTCAVVALFVPPAARVTIAGEVMRSKGCHRYFQSPPLTRGKKYSYSVTVEWKKGEHVCKETRDIPVVAGEVSRAFFMLPIEIPPEP